MSAYPDPARSKASLNARVKTYLEVNCAICHVADGGGNSKIELGSKTPLAKAHLIDEPPVHENLGISDARLIAPGSARKIGAVQTNHAAREKQMPPISTNVVDEQGARLIEEWIRSLPRKTALMR